MRVFVTGATGYIGSAVVRALVQAGHEVGGLVRSRDKEAEVRALGAVPIVGRLQDPETYQHFAAESAAAIHTAFESPTLEQSTAEHLIAALKAEGEQKTFVLTSGVLVLGDTGNRPVDESASTDNAFRPVAWRPAIERYVIDQANEQLATAVIRPGFVYGKGRKSVLTSYVQSALKGPARYIAPGTNHMAYVHRDDVAELYRLIVEKRARGMFHGVDESRVTNQELATAVSRAAGQGGKTQALPIEEARQKIGPFADAYLLEQQVVSRRSRELGWQPKHRNILDDIEAAIAENRGA